MAFIAKIKAPIGGAEYVINSGEFADNFSLARFIGEKHVLLFFYPLDFTFICPTGIIDFQDKMSEIECRNFSVVGCSADSTFSHRALLNSDLMNSCII